MPVARFVHDSVSVIFSRGPLRPTRSAKLAQADPKSAGGVRFGADYYYRDDLIPLTWPGMAETELLLLQALFLERGITLPFYYFDVTGSGIEVFFSEPKISTHEIAEGRFAVSLSLRVA